MRTNSKNGFVALTLVISIMSLLLAFSFMQSTDIGHFFDMTLTKEYRMMNDYNAQSCIDQVVLNIAHDYFYELLQPINIDDFNCVIDSVIIVGDMRVIKVHGNYKGINVVKTMKVKVLDSKLLINQ